MKKMEKEMEKQTKKKTIAQGAEAKLYIDGLDGQKVLVKERIKKDYRLPQIDGKLRRTRTKAEAKLLTDARKLGVHTPQILRLAEDKIIMQFVEGKKVKDIFDSPSGKNIKQVCVKIGESIGKLHAADIIHGDLTTSNMILSSDDKNKISDGKSANIFFIDFGLGGYSKRIEDKATDLKLLREVLQSTHWKILKPCWDNILKGYKQEYREADAVVRQISDIERRARYAKRD